MKVFVEIKTYLFSYIGRLYAVDINIGFWLEKCGKISHLGSYGQIGYTKATMGGSVPTRIEYKHKTIEYCTGIHGV